MFPVKCAGNIEVLNLYMSDWLLLKKSMIELSISKLCFSIRLKLLFSILVENSFQGFFFFNSDVFIFRRIFVQLAPNGSGLGVRAGKSAGTSRLNVSPPDAKPLLVAGFYFKMCRHCLQISSKVIPVFAGLVLGNAKYVIFG